ncbi:myosin-10-like [Trematomus bernacchii]|uniref:myosin-10-like n=1 Tax=Trematomus bernacchii TaxID=40690 RepID=UPI00146B45F9|nr:myosin-10-like [Trematomus bernacchii]
MSPKSLLQPLDQVLLSAEEKLKKRSLALKQVSTSKALEELMGFQTQARLEKEKMEAKIHEMEEDLKKEKTRSWDLSCQWLEEINSLRTELSVFQSHNQHLKEENARVTQKQVSTSEAFEELMGLQTQAKMEKEEMDAKINQMEEDFNKEKKTWSDLSCQRLEEISSLGTELSDAQSHIDHLKEENAKLTIKDDSTSEAFEELKGLQTQAKMEKEEMVAKVNEIEEDFNKEKTSLRTELSDAQSHIDHPKEENAKLTRKDDSTSEDLEELMGLQSQAKTEKEEMEAKINQMEEDFNKEKTTWSDLSCQRLEEISSLGTELSVAQSHIDHLKEENAKLTIKDDSTSEAFEELMDLQTQEKEEMEAKINEMEEDFKKEKTTWSDLSCQRLEEISSLRTELSVAQSHIDHLKEENVKLTIKDDSTSEAFEELMDLQTQEKEEMEAKINEMEEDFKKEKTTWSDLSCQRLEEISSLGTELSDAQSHIDHLKEENVKLTIKDDSTSEAFEELMDLQTQEKEEMEAKINEMEEDFKKEKTTWSDLSCQRLEEISSLGTELSDAQSHIDHLKEENVKLTIKDDSTSEAFKELKGLQTQAKMEKEEMEAKINDIEEDFKKEKTSLRMELSDVQSHIDHLKEENAKLTIKDDSTSEDLKELMGLQTQAKMEKEEMEAKINQMEEDFNKEKTTWSDLSCQRLEEISSLGTELSVAQSHIDHLREENAKLTIKDDSTSEAFEELMDLQTQAKMEKEEMVAKLNMVEEDFNKEKTTWSELSCQRLGEISSLGTELSDAQSHIDHQKEENAKLNMKDDSTSEAFKDLMGLQTQAKMEKEEMAAKINEIEEDFEKDKTSLKMELSDAHSNIDHLKEELLDSRRQAEREITSLQESFSIQIQESSARISATVDHWREVIRGTEEEAATTIRESKEAWQGRFKQLEKNIESKGGLISSLIDKMRASAYSHRQTLNLLSRNRSELCESQKSVDALKETYQTELTEKENSCQRRVAEMVSRNELERLLLQKEAEGMRRTSALEEEIQRLIREKRQLQV